MAQRTTAHNSATQNYTTQHTTEQHSAAQRTTGQRSTAQQHLCYQCPRRQNKSNPATAGVLALMFRRRKPLESELSAFLLLGWACMLAYGPHACVFVRASCHS
jgi:hypothetical protein